MVDAVRQSDGATTLPGRERERDSASVAGGTAAPPPKAEGPISRSEQKGGDRADAERAVGLELSHAFGVMPPPENEDEDEEAAIGEVAAEAEAEDGAGEFTEIAGTK